MLSEIIYHAQTHEAWLPLLLAGLQAGEGLYSMISGQSKLDELHKQKFSEYSETPEEKQARLSAQERAKGGFTAEENAAREQRLARAENTGYQRAIDTAPTQAKAVLAGINYANVGAQNDWAAKDAEMHRKNIQYADAFTQKLQHMADMNIQSQQKNRLMAEESLGKAVSDSRGRLFGAGNTLLAGQALERMGKTPTTSDVTSKSGGDDWFQKALNPAYNSVMPWKSEGENATPYAEQATPQQDASTDMPTSALDVLQMLYKKKYQ